MSKVVEGVIATAVFGPPVVAATVVGGTLLAPVVGAAAGVAVVVAAPIAVAAAPIAAVYYTCKGVKYAWDNRTKISDDIINYFQSVKERNNLVKELKEQHQNIINSYMLEIDSSITELNEAYKNRPLPPVGMLFTPLTIICILAVIILANGPMPILSLPVAIFYIFYFCYESTPERKKIYSKYREDYKIWTGEIQSYREKFGSTKLKCLNAICKLEKWYIENNYKIKQFNDPVAKALDKGENFSMKLGGINESDFKTRNITKKYRIEYVVTNPYKFTVPANNRPYVDFYEMINKMIPVLNKND